MGDDNYVALDCKLDAIRNGESIDRFVVQETASYALSELTRLRAELEHVKKEREELFAAAKAVAEDACVDRPNVKSACCPIWQSNAYRLQLAVEAMESGETHEH